MKKPQNPMLVAPVPGPGLHSSLHDRRIHAPGRSLRRWLFLGLVLGTTLLGTYMMLAIVSAQGISALEILILALFVPTFSWISVAFWNATIGFVLLATRRDPLSLRPSGPRSAESLAQVRNEPALTSRTALVMPAHNEDTTRLMRGLHAMVRSLDETGVSDAFDIFLLSDTTDLSLARAEEEAWEQLVARLDRPERLHYRRRTANTGRKAGNIADFCAKAGSGYDYLVVLDADSLMSGTTLVELVRTLEANPEAGLIQTVPIPAGQHTLFARFVQFGAALYSPMLAMGQSFWQTDSANYWGHNAIIRMAPFIEHAKLPVLPGRPPLGGEVLSHDFVEAALLRRAGWHVYLLPALGDSYEEVPGNLIDFAKRDRRWAQGSLQHLRLLGMPGLKAMSRVHFGFGAMGYISSLLWLLTLLASTAYVLVPAFSSAIVPPDTLGTLDAWRDGGLAAWFPLLGFTAVVLFAPKALGIGLNMVRARRAFGGGGRFLASALLEALFSVVIAPLAMMFHAYAVLSIALGRTIDWSAQHRDGREVHWGEAFVRARSITFIGAVWAVVTVWVSPMFFLWLTPIFAGLLLSVPLLRVTSSASLGRWLRDRGVLLVPTEASCPPLLEPGAWLGAGDNAKTKEVRSMYEAERGLFDLRRGRSLCVTAPTSSTSEASVLVAAVEGLDTPALRRMRTLGLEDPRLILTSHRARHLGLPGLARNSSDGPVSVAVGDHQPEDLFRLSSGREPLSTEAPDSRVATPAEAAGLALTRLGGMLPATVAVAVDARRSGHLKAAIDSAEILSIETSQIDALVHGPQRPDRVVRVSDAPVPLDEDENARFTLFREANGLLEHVAILIGREDEWPDPVPVRLHSACLTGDLFGSLRCDCGEQLRGSLEVFADCGGGVLLYLAQEGRGIGLGNKLRAYSLQEEGLDTVDADSVLGFGADERRYAPAVGMLRELGVQRVRLLTNNPEKVRALEHGGIEVVDRQPLHGTLNRHNLPYVRAKVQRAGHWLGEMLHGASPGQ